MTETPKLLCKDRPPPSCAPRPGPYQVPPLPPALPPVPPATATVPAGALPSDIPVKEGWPIPSQNAPDPHLYPGTGDDGTASWLQVTHPAHPNPPPTLNTWEEGSSASDFGCPHAVPGPRFEASPVPVGAWPHTPKTLPPPQVSAAPRQPGGRRLFAPLPVWGEQWLWDGGPTASAPSSSWDAVS